MDDERRTAEQRSLEYVKATLRLEGLEPDPRMDDIMLAVGRGEIAPDRAIRLSLELARREIGGEKGR